jgi:hypothetical protein
MGLPTPRFPCSSFNEVLMVPGYVPACNDSDGDEELLLYSPALQQQHRAGLQ